MQPNLKIQLIFFDLAIFREKWVVKVRQKVQNLGPSLFYENSNPSNFFQTMFLLATVLPLMRISVILDHIWGSRGPKSLQKGPLHGCWIGTQNFEKLLTSQSQMLFSWNLPWLSIFVKVKIENILEPEIQFFVVISINF